LVDKVPTVMVESWGEDEDGVEGDDFEEVAEAKGVSKEPFMPVKLQ
jgi:hypothetical protein